MTVPKRGGYLGSKAWPGQVAAAAAAAAGCDAAVVGQPRESAVAVEAAPAVDTADIHSHIVLAADAVAADAAADAADAADDDAAAIVVEHIVDMFVLVRAAGEAEEVVPALVVGLGPALAAYTLQSATTEPMLEPAQEGPEGRPRQFAEEIGLDWHNSLRVPVREAALEVEHMS
jgi:hypothetical protein